MENARVIIEENVSFEENKSELRLSQSQEVFLSAFFKRIGLKANHCQLIRAFLKISNGGKYFEASFPELAEILFDTDSVGKDTLRKRVANQRNALLKWQDENNLEIIRVLKEGSRKETDSGKFDYSKTQYELLILDDLMNATVFDSESLTENINSLVLSLSNQFEPLVRMGSHHPRHQAKKNKKNILTKFKRTFQLLAGIGEDSITYCQDILEEAQILLDKLEAEREEQSEILRYKASFEDSFSEDETENNKEDLGLNY